jgi:hypothetical protein
VSTTAEQIETWFKFLRDRAAEIGTPQFNLMVGYSYGQASALLDAGREDLALTKLPWLINESARFKHHPEYPGRETETSPAPPTA